MKCYIYRTSEDGFLMTGEAKSGGYKQVWSFDAINSKDAALKFNRFSWIYTHHKSETEALKALSGKENPTLLPNYEWVKNAVKEKNSFVAVIAIRTIKPISISEAQDEVQEIWKRLFESS